MKDKDKLIVLDTDDNAATLQTVTGWVSRTGRFFGKDEAMARYAGCTHRKCDCGGIMERGWTKCDSCRRKLEKEKYYNLPFKEWTNEEYVYSYQADEFFRDSSEIDDYLDDNEDIKVEDLRLVLCQPIHASKIDMDRWEDELPEEGDYPKELVKKVEELNNFISTLKPLSWEPSNVRTEYKPKL